MFDETINRVSALVKATPEITEMDINPHLCISDRVAVDARIRTDKKYK
ncbi:acetate--CoA ligase family protein [Bacteroidota bacterium]